jgi:hypothetical protein
MKAIKSVAIANVPVPKAPLAMFIQLEEAV